MRSSFKQVGYDQGGSENK